MDKNEIWRLSREYKDGVDKRIGCWLPANYMLM